MRIILISTFFLLFFFLVALLKHCEGGLLGFGEMEVTLMPQRSVYERIYGVQHAGYAQLLQLLAFFTLATQNKFQYAPIFVPTNRLIEKLSAEAVDLLHLQTNVFLRLVMLVLPHFWEDESDEFGVFFFLSIFDDSYLFFAGNINFLIFFYLLPFF